MKNYWKGAYLVLSAFLFIFMGCQAPAGSNSSANLNPSDPDPAQSKQYLLQYENSKIDYGNEIFISTKNIEEDDSVCFEKTENKIVIKKATPKDSSKDVEIYIEGYFNGQIVNEVDGLIINLRGAYIENANAPAIVCNTKTEISSKKDTTNYVITTGNIDSSAKTGAITCAKDSNLDLGGAGTCYVIGSVCHGIKTDKMQFKGSGTYYVQGSKEGSSINCNKFVIKPADPESPDKMVTVNLYNAKNGIKADKSISIENGKLNFYGNTVALKTNKADAGSDPYTINLSNCSITLKDVTTLQDTDNFTKGENVVIEGEMTPVNPSETEKKPKKDYSNDINPIAGSNAAASQKFIFSTDSVGFTTITIRRSEWNKMLSYFDYFYKNENLVNAESYEYTKDGKEWKLNNVGLRLRGNPSRFRPQGKDTADDKTGHRQMNANWSQDYYNYAATCSDNDYRQSHFKVDFEPFDDDDRKMSDCMKGVALKRSDEMFSREIFCYNLFHQYGVWTAPHASQTKVYIKFIEDVDENGSRKDNISECLTTTIDYGVYEMFEEVNKQSLKGRAKKDNNNTSENAWANNNGDLWKCSGADLNLSSWSSEKAGCEDIKIYNTDKDESQWTFKFYNPKYDLKTNKTNVDSARAKLKSFIDELNALSNKDKNTEEGILARKSFYEKWFDVDFFIKTYAVNILVGMDDDYWANANNYYLYFDNGKGGTGKCYLIPFDYDNTLGRSILNSDAAPGNGDRLNVNPLEWGISQTGEPRERPLMDRLLEVPEYRTKMINTLLEVSSQDSNSPWNKYKCFALWNKWLTQVEPYVYSSDLEGHICALGIYDDGGYRSTKHYLTQENNNIYEQVTLNFRKWLSNIQTNITFDLNGGLINESSNSITKKYDGSANLSDMIERPYRLGYVFNGWTKTKDGTDYISIPTDDAELTVYASWKTVSTKVTINTTKVGGIQDNISIVVEAKEDGLHIQKSNDKKFVHVNIPVTDLTTGVSLFEMNNVDNDGKNIRTEEFVYPCVEKDHVYLLSFDIYDENYQQWHSVSCSVKAVGGTGDLFINCDGFSYDKTTKTITLKNLTKQLPDSDEHRHHIVGMFKNEMWATEADSWDYRWKIVDDSENKIKIYSMDWDTRNYGEETTWFDTNDKIFIYVGYEFNAVVGSDSLFLRKSLVETELQLK